MVTRKLLSNTILLALAVFIVYSLYTHPGLQDEAPAVMVLENEIVRVHDKDRDNLYFIRPLADTSLRLTERRMPVEDITGFPKVTLMTVADMRDFFAQKISPEEWLKVAAALKCVGDQRSGC